MKRGQLCCASVAYGDGKDRAELNQQTRVKQREYAEDVKMAEVNLITWSKKPPSLPACWARGEKCFRLQTVGCVRLVEM